MNWISKIKSTTLTRCIAGILPCLKAGCQTSVIREDPINKKRISSVYGLL